MIHVFAIHSFKPVMPDDTFCHRFCSSLTRWASCDLNELRVFERRESELADFNRLRHPDVSPRSAPVFLSFIQADDGGCR